MKYLKLFEKYITISDIQEDIDDYLSYLLDDDSYHVDLVDVPDGNAVATISITLWKNVSVAMEIIKWDNIKDYFIPFLHFINGKYSLKQNIEGGITFNEYGGPFKKSKYVTLEIEDVLNDSTKIPQRFYSIKFFIYCE